MLAIAAVCAGTVLGWLAGGRLRGLAQPWLRLEAVVLPLFIIQGVARGRLAYGLPSLRGGGVAVWAVVSIALALVLTLSINRPGVVLAIIGILSNVWVVLLNTAMPVGGTRGAVTGLGLASSGRGFYRLISEATLVPFAGDVIPLQFASGLYMMSLGDVLLLVSVVTVLSGAMLNSKVTKTQHLDQPICAIEHNELSK